VEGPRCRQCRHRGPSVVVGRVMDAGRRACQSRMNQPRTSASWST
jgi:hypothetical protein